MNTIINNKNRFLCAILIITGCCSFTAFSFLGNDHVFISNTGMVTFTSKAPLETIKAESKKLSGAISTGKRTFAFTIPVSSFEGFNSPLQKEHFNESYMESDKIPKAVFKGKIIEEVNIEVPGTYSVRAKGMMNIHGVEKEMIIKSKIISTASQINVESAFTIQLKDFHIKVPQIVKQKIAEDILIDVRMELHPKK